MEVIIDPKSGFCFGVERAIRMAEEEVALNRKLYCLGDIVHNDVEVGRLRRMGVEFISVEEYVKLSDCRVLIRAHGEPPSTYEYAKNNNIELLDATCKVVVKLQDRIYKIQQSDPLAQIVIYGRKDHPEVVGLCGQVEQSIVIDSITECDRVDTGKKVYLLSQTTKDKTKYAELQAELKKRLIASGLSETDLITTNSICGQVANRGPWLGEFSKTVDAVVFVGGKSSSNSKVLFGTCLQANPQSYFVTEVTEVDDLLLSHLNRIGVCGATSTPRWLIEDVAERIKSNLHNLSFT